ncbi:AraC-like DNA-binding protein [Alkalibacterium olivapovliticus]|uniref:AraC-like DNA-binding protein n=2 Tax=Alkalibacterium olivapovliticus TaxID=99907 RepID=A0A2T0WAE9_9LACT|nr:AraC-like DNA-binding protein [Alkalibacterium olivapovliticus]
MQMDQINSKMKRYSSRGEAFMYAPSIIAEANISGMTSPFEFHSHQQYEIYILLKGQVHYLINNQIFSISPGTIIVMDGTELHKVKLIQEDEPYQRSIVHFDPNWIRSILKVTGAEFLVTFFEDYHHRLFTFKETDDMEQLLALVQQLSELTVEKGTEEKETEIRLRLINLLLHLYTAEKLTILQETDEKSEKARLAESIASYIQQHFNSKWTIETLADDLNISQSYASHLFKEVTGFTIIDYLMNYRLIQAKAYLTMSSENLSIKECAYNCGFESNAHFNRFFKKKTGITPNNYRKKHKNERNLN